LDDGSLAHRNGSVFDGMYGQSAVARYDGPRFDATESSVGNRLLARFEALDPANDAARMMHRRHVEELSTITGHEPLGIDTSGESREHVEKIYERRRLGQRRVLRGWLPVASVGGRRRSRWNGPAASASEEEVAHPPLRNPEVVSVQEVRRHSETGILERVENGVKEPVSVNATDAGHIL
jgi:hypothetical protein